MLIKAIDLFAGIGGIRLGFETAGFKIVYSNDVDKECCRTYRENFGEIDEKDIRLVNIDEIPDAEVLLAGFPCQPYSMIGKRNGLKDERGKLFFHIVKILSVKKPAVFFLENVRHLLNHDKGATYERVMSGLEWAGYRVFSKILDSQHFDVPQHRERLYIVGFLKDFFGSEFEFNFPEGSKINTKIKDILEAKVDENYYLSERYYTGLLAHKERHKKAGNGFGCQILSPKGIANTLVAGNMGRERNLIVDKPTNKNRWGIRRLTIRECARLQGFPDNFQFPVSITRTYEQLGNSVTVPVVNAIASEIKKVIEQSPLVAAPTVVFPEPISLSFHKTATA